MIEEALGHDLVRPRSLFSLLRSQRLAPEPLHQLLLLAELLTRPTFEPLEQRRAQLSSRLMARIMPLVQEPLLSDYQAQSMVGEHILLLLTLLARMGPTIGPPDIQEIETMPRV